ncbi:Vomeronasal type-1 receptor 2 [Fukomys damarensis]|uniref:Vomeronasal type-1 receptor n=1 Tax=Fukomys damarensis TaxID=885580 RepID=A0A091E1C5_FUKDA|nr:Vomeronasal type-1 receptor 2 [Fukomys damarensis]
MASADWRFGVIFLFEIGIGASGNLALLCHYCILCCRGCRPRSADVILRHLTVANTLAILSRGIPETMAAFGMEGFLSDAGCKPVFYAHRVGRGASMGSTCLLSVFQAVGIGPRRSRGAELKAKALNHIGSSSALCWGLHMPLSVRVPVLGSDTGVNGNITETVDFQCCSATLPDKDKASLFGVLTLSHDILCLELMVWASGSTVFILFRHKQRVHHLHSHSSCRSSPETRASQSILVLVLGGCSRPLLSAKPVSHCQPLHSRDSGVLSMQADQEELNQHFHCSDA